MTQSILVVDDNADNRDLTRLLLECEGFEVRLAGDGSEAMLQLQGWRPHLILMDVQLPGIDGLELTRRLHQTPGMRDIPIVALSAYAMPADKEKAYDAGCAGYITKPINTRAFGGIVKKYLGSNERVNTGVRKA